MILGDIRNSIDLPSRFWIKVDRSNSCWTWRGTLTDDGYGTFGITLANGVRTTITAHRLALLLARGIVDDDLETCHDCDNPSCCNPAHLFEGTHTVNMHDASVKGRMWRGQGRRPKHDAATRATIAARYASGEPVSALAAEHGICRDTVNRIVHEQGISIRPIGFPKGHGQHWRKHIPSQ